MNEGGRWSRYGYLRSGPAYLMPRVGREIYAAEWRSQGRISDAVDKQRREHNHVIPADSLYRLRVPNPIVNRRPGDLFLR